MKWVCALVIAAACGRLDFDSRALGDGGAGGDGALGDGDASRIPPGAKIWLEMNTVAPAVIADSAGGHQVTCAGTCPASVAGIHGGGFSFDGSQEIDVTYAGDLDASGGFTAASWVKMLQLPSGADDPACFWSMPFDASMGYDTFTLCLDTFGVTIFDGESPTGTQYNQSGPTIGVGEWHHVAMTWDGTKRLGFVDGNIAATRNVQLGSGTMNATLGAEYGGYHLVGVVDDAVYYTRALTQAEITELATP